jgi:hypothetical protein
MHGSHFLHYHCPAPDNLESPPDILAEQQTWVAANLMLPQDD